MSLNDYLKCPGPERSMAATPETYPCPLCGAEVEIWSDERKRRCPDCHHMVYPDKASDRPTAFEAERDAGRCRRRLRQIIQSALDLGASDAAVIRSADIRVEEDLANLCDGEPRCENYGLSPSCPPHVAGPSGFRNLQKQSRHTLVVRLDVPSSALFSDQRREIMQLLHDIVAGVEQAVLKAGFKNAVSFAGGSCKKIFCADLPNCRKLSERAQCRFPERARPSMSGFGINVAELIQTAGWDLKTDHQEEATNPASMSWVAGIIVIQRDQTHPCDLI